MLRGLRATTPGCPIVMRETTPALSSMGVGSLSAPAGGPAHYRGASVQYADVNGFSATGS